MTSRKRAIRAAEIRVAPTIPAYQLDLRPVRGRCLRRRCRSRWAIPRATIDTRDARAIERTTLIECALCGRVWRRIRDVPVQRAGFQSALVTLILPPRKVQRRYEAHGATHVVGEDARIVREAAIGDTDDAAREWRHRSDLRGASRARAAARKAAVEAEAVASFRVTLAAIDARRAAEAEAEAEATAREAAY